MPLLFSLSFFFFNDTATTEIYTLSLHDALPISVGEELGIRHEALAFQLALLFVQIVEELALVLRGPNLHRSEEHTSELQSRLHLVCRLLLEKKKKNEDSSHTAC